MLLINLLNYKIFVFTLWQFAALIYLGIFTIVKTFKLFENAHVKVKGQAKHALSLEHGLKRTYFKDRDYFVLYDIFRLPFLFPSALLGTTILLLKGGAWRLFPFVRKILGYKLFQIKVKDEIEADKI